MINRDRERSLSNVVSGMNAVNGEGILINDGGPMGALKRRWTNTAPTLAALPPSVAPIDQDGDAIHSDAREEEGGVIFDFGPTVEGTGFGVDDQTMEEVMELAPKRRKL